MPLSDNSSSPGWISSDQLGMPRQTLAKSEVDAFLKYLFATVARRPKKLRLREGAAVARYLSALARELEPGPQQQLLEQLARTVWMDLSQFAPVEISDKRQAIAFLANHAETYFANLEVGAALKTVSECPAPTKYVEVVQPHLMSGNRAVFGWGNPYLSNDLSERIYAAYHALKRAAIWNVSGRIAAALNRQGRTTHPKTRAARTWGSYEVYERAKQYEGRLKQAMPAGQGAAAVKRWRESLADMWLHGFHAAQSVDSRNRLKSQD